MTRHLIVSSDGTWQDLSRPYPTNVVKLVQAIMPFAPNGDQQIVYYDEGIGTKQVQSEIGFIDKLIKVLGGCFGVGLDHRIQLCYRFLCLNYQPGDKIHLIGFSRGAYTVRCLAGLIYNSGLLNRRYIREIPRAYEIYRNRSDEYKPSAPKSRQFRKIHGEQIPITSLFCWDTVSSVGLPELPGIGWIARRLNEKYRFHDSRINPKIGKAFHAVSIDEDRKVFNVTPMELHQDSPADQIKQVWFPGGHGAIGGGDINDRGLSDGALEWMIEQARSVGLGLDTSFIEMKTDANGAICYGISPDPTINWQPRSSILRQLGHELRDIPASTTMDDLHVSVKRRWTNQACHYKPTKLVAITSLTKQLDKWKEIGLRNDL